LRNVVLILTVWHAWVPLNDFRLIIRISDWPVLLLSAGIVWHVLLVLLVEYLSYIRTGLVVTETGLTLLTLAYNFLVIFFF